MLALPFVVVLLNPRRELHMCASCGASRALARDSSVRSRPATRVNRAATELPSLYTIRNDTLRSVLSLKIRMLPSLKLYYQDGLPKMYSALEAVAAAVRTVCAHQEKHVACEGLCSKYCLTVPLDRESLPTVTRVEERYAAASDGRAVMTSGSKRKPALCSRFGARGSRSGQNARLAGRPQ